MKCLFHLLLILINIKLAAQDFPRKELNLERLADEIFPIQDTDLNYEELYENLAQVMSNPIDLNKISREQLRSLMVISENEINSFLNYRESNGPLLSVYELQAVPGWNRKIFERIIPFVNVIEPQAQLNTSILKRITEEKNNYLVWRYERTLEPRQGYSNGTDSIHRYMGSPDKLYVRFKVAQTNDFSAGVTAEKDPGESVTWDPSTNKYGFDYVSFHLQLQNKGRLKNLILGDFQSQFGQGLILGSVFGFGKNSETITTIRRGNIGFLPYASANENMFFRGAAISLEASRNFIFHAFGSRTVKDGLVDELPENSFISSFSSSGLHRNQVELQRRQQIGEINLGGVLQFKNRSLDAGLILHHINFSRPYIRTSQPYNQFAFNGSLNQNASIYVNYSWSSITFFTEMARTLSGGNGMVAGMLGNISTKLEISLLFRNFDRDFYSFYSNAFAENSTPQNEQGLYWGWKNTFNKKFALSGYMDIFRFPWLRFRGYAPSEGNEWLIRFNYTPAKNVAIFLQAREEVKIRNLTEESPLYHYEMGTKRNFWINCDYSVSPVLAFKTRAQFSTYSLRSQTTQGFALIQDVSLTHGRWSASFRYALFDTEDYDNRQYIYERNVWLAYSFPAYDGTGIRTYAVVQYKFSKKMDLWIRWSQVRYTNTDQIGSGYDTIEANTGNDIKFQVRIRF